MKMTAFEKGTKKKIGLRTIMKRDGIGAAFSYAARKLRGSSNVFHEAVIHERPDLKGKPAYFPAQGGWSHTLIIGNEVFKGPCAARESESKEFDLEADILQELEGRGLPVPRITCRGKEATFYGMTRLEGVTLDSVMDKMTEPQLQSLAGEVADFVVDMAQKLPRADGLYPLQGDLREPNILVDPETKKLTGIIDFGMAADVTKAQLEARYIENKHFKHLVTEALNQKKSVLPDSPKNHGMPRRSSPAPKQV